MAKRFGKYRRRLWERNPHCFWCGIVTIWYQGETRTPPLNSATIDHIRSRLTPERSRRDENWQPGKIVLACWKCNNDRCRMEQEYYAKNNPSMIREKCGSKPAAESLLKTQSKLATAVVRYVETGGTLDESTIGKEVRRLAARLRKEYQSTRGDRHEDVSDKRGGLGGTGASAALLNGPASLLRHGTQPADPNKVATSTEDHAERSMELRTTD